MMADALDVSPVGVGAVERAGAGLFSAFRADAIHLARANAGNSSVGAVLKTVLANDAFAILALGRVRDCARRWRIPLVNHVLRRAQTILFGIEIGNEVVLGPGVEFIHPFGIVVGGNSRIGAGVRFMGSNTVGTADDNGYPVIDDGVTIGAGARILGPVRVGARAVVGANAVVVRDVPADHVAAGVPARSRPKAIRRGHA